MSTSATTCSHIALLSTALLVCICLTGVLLGFGLALVSMTLYQHYRKKVAAIALAQRKQQELDLMKRRQQQEEIDPMMDERIDCAECWQDRHPGLSFPIPRYRLCCDHTQLMNQSRSLPIDRHLEAEEVCA